VKERNITELQKYTLKNTVKPAVIKRNLRLKLGSTLTLSSLSYGSEILILTQRHKNKL